jgi:hypothetical protein
MVTAEGTRVLARLRKCLLGQATLVDGLDADHATLILAQRRVVGMLGAANPRHT